MKNTEEEETTGMESKEKECDIKIWCEECRQSNYTTSGEKYLCASCGKILNLDHEVHHEIFPHVCGVDDYSSG